MGVSPFFWIHQKYAKAANPHNLVLDLCVCSMLHEHTENVNKTVVASMVEWRVEILNKNTF